MLLRNNRSLLKSRGCGFPFAFREHSVRIVDDYTTGERLARYRSCLKNKPTPFARELNLRSYSTSFHVGEGVMFGSEKGTYPSNTTMWSKQDKVPSLPVPTLEETLQRYISHLEPLVSPAQLENTKRIVKEFQAGEGPRLQQELYTLQKESQTSWLEGFWDSMYLNLRCSVMVNVSPFLLLQDDPLRTSQISRAAHVVMFCLQFNEKIRSNSLEPDMDKEDPYDMAQYRRLFSTARIAQPGRDKYLTWPDSKHIVVIARDHLFALPVYKGSVLVSEGELQGDLQQILQASQSVSGPSPCVLTTGDRDKVAAARQLLNQEDLKLVDGAILVLCLDELSPVTLQEASTAMLHRDGTNRWWDKFAVVTFANGTAGCILEHSPIDGHTCLRLCTEYAKECKNMPVPAGRGSGSYKLLKWNSLPGELLANAHHEAKQLIASMQSDVLAFNQYGKKFITSKKLSPDAFMQMAFQLAYYKVYERTESTYESANTKKFLAGRTETIRSVTKESVFLTHVWTSNKATNKERVDALRRATQTHIERATLAKEGFGVDRHLFGLLNLAKLKQQRIARYQIPAIFVDPSYAKLTTSVLSTSNVSAPIFSLFGFGPVCENGLGLAYNIHDNELIFNVTSFMGEAKKFSKALEGTLLEMKQILESVP